MAKIGIIGGSGLEDPDILKSSETYHVTDPLWRTQLSPSLRENEQY